MACINCNETLDLGAAAPCPPVTPCPLRLCAPISYRDLGWDYIKSTDGCTVRTRAAGVLPNGTYANATITLLDGNITAVTAGANVIQSRVEPCSTAAGGATPAPTPTTPITLSPDPCNLLTGSAANLLAFGHFDQAGRNISVNGCGTAGNPWMLSYTGGVGVTSLATTNLTYTNVAGAVTLNTSGANSNTCGYSIVDGVVKTWVQPVVAITAGAGVSVATNAATCNVTVASTNQSRSVTGVSCGTNFVDPFTAALPVNATWKVGHVVVSEARVHFFCDSPSNFYDKTGAIVATGPTSVIFPGNDLALALMESVYSFSGLTAC